MSTLNTFGFNVRRKRQQDVSLFTSTKGKTLPSKESSSGPAFAAMPHPATPSLKPTIKKASTHVVKSKRPSPRDPKQSTLLPFFTVKQDTHVPQRLDEEERNDNTSTSTPQTTKEEANEVCVIRRRVTVIEILPILMEAFQGYGNNQPIERPLYRHQDTPDNTILLRLKSIHTETMDYDLDTTTARRQRRRRRHDEEDRSTATLHTAFARSVSLKPIKKRLCSSRQDQHHNRIGVIEDELDQNQGEEDREIRMVRHCLSTNQVNALLLDIANEVFAFDNNTWCTSYFGQ